ncbi:hypothetical protein ACE939_08845 [Aquimarina sp. W85]|uniref:hypothetical protein n=1 Tax=Aquimarina rhodophyticola TaxID=3342246 RepID=UPI00366DB6AC
MIKFGFAIAASRFFNRCDKVDRTKGARAILINVISVPKDDISSGKEDISVSKDDISSGKDDISVPKDDISSGEDDISVPKDDISSGEDDISLVKDFISVAIASIAIAICSMALFNKAVFAKDFAVVYRILGVAYYFLSKNWQ